MSAPMKIAIIGSAGRNGTSSTRELFEAMKKRAMDIIKNELALDPRNVHLVSGGAALSDHVAVQMFHENEFEGITLFLPCDWSNGKHVDNGEYNWKSNPGRSANRYHREFARQTGIDSLKDIDTLQNHTVVRFDTTSKGFHARNSKIANNADILIAFTFSSSQEPPQSGGTHDTWTKARRRGIMCIHVSLNDLID